MIIEIGPRLMGVIMVAPMAFYGARLLYRIAITGASKIWGIER